MNLLYAVIGVLLGTAVGVLPGIGPAMTVALLLPITYNVPPSAAFIMFAGIFYGGMYGGSTTSILLNTPGESSSVITAIEGNKMAKAGRAAQALGDRGDRIVRRGRHRHHPAGGVRAVDLAVRGHFGRPVLPGDHAVGAGDGDRGAGLLAAARGDRAAVGAGDRPRRHRLADRAAARHLRAAAAVRRHRHRGDRGGDLRARRGAVGGRASAAPPGRDHSGRPAVDEPQGLRSVVEAVAARHRLRVPVRRAARRRRRTADVFVVCHREEALQAPRGVRPWRDRGGGRPGGGQQRLGGGHAGADAVAGVADQRHRGGDPGGVRVLRDSARPHAVREGAAADLDADRQPVHRQLPAAGAQPAVGAAVGQAAAYPAAVPVCGHPVLRHAGGARGQRAMRWIWRCCWCSVCSG